MEQLCKLLLSLPLPAAAKMRSAYARLGAGRLAGTAPDALRTVGRLIDGDVHWAGLLAGPADNTGLLIHLKAVQRNRIKQPVNRPQRTEIPAERPMYRHREYDHNQENQYLPGKKRAYGASQPLV